MSGLAGSLSNERLEQEIAGVYWRGFREAPGVVIREQGILAELWEEFDYRFEKGLIDRDTDWEPREDWEVQDEWGLF